MCKKTLENNKKRKIKPLSLTLTFSQLFLIWAKNERKTLGILGFAIGLIWSSHYSIKTV